MKKRCLKRVTLESRVKVIVNGSRWTVHVGDPDKLKGKMPQEWIHRNCPLGRAILGKVGGEEIVGNAHGSKMSVKIVKVL